MSCHLQPRYDQRVCSNKRFLNLALIVLLVCVVSGGCRGESPSTPSTVSDRQPAEWDTGLAIQEAEDISPDDGVVEIALVAREATLELRTGVQTKMWTYNGSVPGPIIRARKGQTLTVQFTNQLSEPTTVHWHGLRVPVSMDGSPAVQNPVQPGEHFVYSFPLLDAGTYWYHPHINSSAQIGYGLYGAIIVEDPNEPFLGDPLVLVLSDASLDDAGQLQPGDSNGWFGDYFGREGNVLLVNGRIEPLLRARVGATQRWHVINASRSRFHQFSLQGHTLTHVGGDGGLAEHAQPMASVLLTPGERAELLFTPEASAISPMPVEWQDANRFHLPTPPSDRGTLFHIAIDSGSPWPHPIAVANPLRTIAPLDVTNARSREIVLGEDSEDGAGVLTINGAPFGGDASLVAHVGTTELWTVRNTTYHDHPFHLHGFFFQPLSIGDNLKPVMQWKDTINVPAGSDVRFAVAYDNRPGEWMFHCHIVDHADLGMMGMLHVLDPEEPHTVATPHASSAALPPHPPVTR